MADNEKPSEDGFELNGKFYRWSVSDGGKDLMLIDRFAKMPVTDFFDIIEDSFDRGRAPILLALIATSVMAQHPEWSVERVERTVLNLHLSDVTFIDSDAEEDTLPPGQGGKEPPTLESSGSSSDVSLSTQDSTTYETFSGTPV